MVHDEADALFVGVFVQSGQVEVRIRCEEVEDELLLLAVPVLPADVPTFYQHLVQSVLGSKAMGSGEVDVAAHIGVIGAMRAVGLGVFIISLTEFHRWEVVGISPGALARDHLPPNAHVFHRVNP